MAGALEGYERYHEFMDKLTENNVDDYIDLPQIAVMGDTSSGKSSLLSNISLVELPSADKLTTRCPIMLKMHHDKSRSACVKVSWKDKPEVPDVDFAERKIAEENWNSITGAIAAAQAHIIAKSGKEVARDIVSVDMRGPHCSDLTLIDLPGIVRTVGREESATLAEDIQSLMNDYLANERCVILAVLPCNVDFHNSQIMAEARKVDPDTKRTIPVLTKPDLIDSGGEGGVKDLLLGKKTDSFEMGFHMTKGRGQTALNNKESIEEGLKSEDSFFSNTEPWRGVEDRSLFGTKNLRAKLARLQMDIIRTSFKDIVADLRSQLEDSLARCQALGEIPTNLVSKRALFRSTREEIWKGISGPTLDGPISSLHSDTEMRPSAEFHEASQQFQDTLNSSKLATVSDIAVGKKVVAMYAGQEVRDEVCFIDEEGGKVYLKECVHSAGVTFTSSSVTNQRTGKPGNVIQYSSCVYIEREDGTVDQLRAFQHKLVRPDPEWIGDLIKKNRPYKLPIFINTHIFEAIVAELIGKEWKKPALELLDFTSTLMDTAAEQFIKQMGAIKSFPMLEAFLITKASEIIDSLKSNKRAKVEDFIKRETHPYTQNHYLFENVCKLRSQRLMDEVLLALPQGTSSVTMNPSSLASAVRNIFKRNQERSVDSHMSEEMQIALDGYGKVALKRFIDNVPMICIEIMQNFADEMNDSLCETSDEEIERIVAAPSNTVTKMNQLKRKAETLKRGIDALRELF